MSALAPLNPRSVVDEAFDALRAQILSGTWAPGDRLPTEAALTEALGVSRSTVREALNRLASAGLIEVRHGGSKTVLDFRDHAGLEVLASMVVDEAGGLDLGVVRAVTEMRAALVPDIARLAASRRTDVQAEALVAIATALDPAEPLDTLIVETLDWWTALVHASGNLAYRLAYNTLRTTCTEGRAVLQQVIADELRAADRYLAVTDAVARRDPEAAEREARALVALGTDALLRTLSDLT